MVAITDAVTGVMETAKVTIHVAREIPKYRDSFTILFQSATLSTLREIKPITAKILMYLNAITLYSNIIDRTVNEMATDLGYKKNQILKGLKQLSDLNILIKTPHPGDGRRSMLMINPHQSWKGKPVERAKKIAQLGNDAQLKFPFGEQPKTLALQPNNEFHKQQE
jgi:DNA-binding MarR family transcriptional regulator